MKKITFEKAQEKHKNSIFAWLENPHVIEFWDNSKEHRVDILLFINGRIEKSPYFEGKHDYHYWIGSIDNDPFCMMMTSELIRSECVKENSPYVPYLSEKGRTIALDFMIGNEKYLGKGLAGEAIEVFTRFFQEKMGLVFDTFMIDPGFHNPRACRVYEKAGFKIVGDYTSKSGYFEGSKAFIMIKKMPYQVSVK